MTEIHEEIAPQKRGGLLRGKYTFIYFVQIEGFIKIGQSTRWRSRLSHMRTASPFTITVLHVELHEPSFEKSMHRRFAKLHHRGEWFRAEEPLLGFVKTRAAEPNRSWLDYEGGW